MNHLSRTYLDQAAQAQGFSNRTATPAVNNGMTAGAGAGEQLQYAVRPQQVMQAAQANEVTANSQGFAGEMGAQRSVEAAVNQDEYRTNAAMQLNQFIAENTNRLNIPSGSALSDIGEGYLRMLSTQMT